MKIKFQSSSQFSFNTEVLTLPLLENKLTALTKKLDQKLKGQISKIIKDEDIKGKVGDCRVVDITGDIGTLRAVVLIGLGDPKKISAENLLKYSAQAYRQAKKLKAKAFAVEDPETPSFKHTETGEFLAEGTILGSYHFTHYKAEEEKKKKNAPQEVTFLSSNSKIEKGFLSGEAIGEATNLARDMINIPACDLTPKHMADEARRIAKKPHLSVVVHDKEKIQKMGMGCFWAVARGSEEPPYFIHMTYTPPQKAKKKIVIIGKGVTFDSGGLSLKPPAGMETMKDDMSGSAAVIATMQVLSILKPSVEVHALAAMTENMPSGTAERPGDVAKAMNGKTVEILNTDAEGRLTLADALCYAQEKIKPDLIIDMATLTGACVVALGELCAAILGNDQKLMDKVIESGKAVGERIWQLPMIEEYREEIKSTVADIKNVGGRWGGTINGALFLDEFVDKKMPWVHIDIAGPSWTEKDLTIVPRGGTGFMVRTLVHFLQNQA